MSQNCPFPFDDHHQNLIPQYKTPGLPSAPTASRSMQPFCKDVKCGPTDRDTYDRPRCVAVYCGNVADGLQTIVVLYGACSANNAPCSGVHHILSSKPHCNNSVSLRKRISKQYINQFYSVHLVDIISPNRNPSAYPYPLNPARRSGSTVKFLQGQGVRAEPGRQTLLAYFGQKSAHLL